MGETSSGSYPPVQSRKVAGEAGVVNLLSPDVGELGGLNRLRAGSLSWPEMAPRSPAAARFMGGLVCFPPNSPQLGALRKAATAGEKVYLVFRPPGYLCEKERAVVAQLDRASVF